MDFLIDTLRLSIANLWLNKLRSALTSLGIICGVAAVITMVAIGEGSKRKALEAIEQLGSRIIIVKSVKPPEAESASSEVSFLLSYGIRRDDVRRIEQTIGNIKRVVPVKRVGSKVLHEEFRAPSSVFVGGTHPKLRDVLSLEMASGRYLSDSDLEKQRNCAVIGAEVAVRLFPLEDPIGRSIRVTLREMTHPFRVVGVLAPIGLAGGSSAKLVGRDLNFDVHIPITTAKSRFGDQNFRRTSGSSQGERVELSEMYIEAEREDEVILVADQIKRVLEEEHGKGLDSDVKVIVPLELLYETKRSKAMFNALMAVIAAISLLVGGIGILNIMLASVIERTREIGIRRAVGATQGHIIAQFLTETVVLSGIGGVIGVVVGVGSTPLLAMIAEKFPDSFGDMGSPVVTEWSIILSFIVATSVGVIFGVYPAVMASRQDPIVALRHD